MAAQATRRSGRIGLREVRKLGPGEVVWDAGSGAVTGFGARRQRSEAVSFIVVYRTREGRQRWHTIGRYGSPWTPDEARVEAKRLLGIVAAGGDPAGQRQADRRALTVASLCDLYVEAMRAGRILTRRGEPKRPSTAANDHGRIERHVKPLVGHLPAASLRPQDAEDFMHRVAEGATAATVKVRARGVARVTGGRATASRTIVLLQAIYGWGVRKGHVVPALAPMQPSGNNRHAGAPRGDTAAYTGHRTRAGRTRSLPTSRRVRPRAGAGRDGAPRTRLAPLGARPSPSGPARAGALTPAAARSLGQRGRP
jgi:hypothetical protein